MAAARRISARPSGNVFWTAEGIVKAGPRGGGGAMRASISTRAPARAGGLYGGTIGVVRASGPARIEAADGRAIPVASMSSSARYQPRQAHRPDRARSRFLSHVAAYDLIASSARYGAVFGTMSALAEDTSGFLRLRTGSRRTPDLVRGCLSSAVRLRLGSSPTQWNRAHRARGCSRAPVDTGGYEGSGAVARAGCWRRGRPVRRRRSTGCCSIRRARAVLYQLDPSIARPGEMGGFRLPVGGERRA